MNDAVALVFGNRRIENVIVPQRSFERPRGMLPLTTNDFFGQQRY